jgi:hypothetical protein
LASRGLTSFEAAEEFPFDVLAAGTTALLTHYCSGLWAAPAYSLAPLELTNHAASGV